MLTSTEYFAAGEPQITTLALADRANAQRSLTSLAPGVTDANRAAIQSTLDPQLPYFIVDSNGAPHLVIPAAPPETLPTPFDNGPPETATSPPVPPAPAPPPAPPASGLDTAAQPTTVITSGVCPSGYVTSKMVSAPGAATPLDLALQQQLVASGSAAPAGTTSCICNPILAAPQAVDKNDVLVVSLWNTYTCPTTITVNARIMDCNCQLNTYSMQTSMTPYTRFNAPNNGQIVMPLTEGYLLSVNISMTAAFVSQGHMWTVAEIRDASATGQSSATLIQDYLQFGKTLGWPGGNQLSVGDGPGTNRWRNWLYDPAGGDSDTWQVPDGCLGLVRQVYFGLTTSAVAGNRVVYLAYTPPEGLIMQFGGSQSQPPSTSWGWVFAPGIQQGLFHGFIAQEPIPPNIWNGGAGGLSLFVDGNNAADHMDRGGVAFQMWAGPTVAF